MSAEALSEDTISEQHKMGKTRMQAAINAGEGGNTPDERPLSSARDDDVEPAFRLVDPEEERVLQTPPHKEDGGNNSASVCRRLSRRKTGQCDQLGSTTTHLLDCCSDCYYTLTCDRDEASTSNIPVSADQNEKAEVEGVSEHVSQELVDRDIESNQSAVEKEDALQQGEAERQTTSRDISMTLEYSASRPCYQGVSVTPDLVTLSSGLQRRLTPTKSCSVGTMSGQHTAAAQSALDQNITDVMESQRPLSPANTNAGCNISAEHQHNQINGDPPIVLLVMVKATSTLSNPNTEAREKGANSRNRESSPEHEHDKMDCEPPMTLTADTPTISPDPIIQAQEKVTNKECGQYQEMQSIVLKLRQQGCSYDAVKKHLDVIFLTDAASFQDDSRVDKGLDKNHDKTMPTGQLSNLNESEDTSYINAQKRCIAYPF
ncbi:uncharacterized protein LOC129592324 [Paramacrobiotus metropolitanus]|uniref:uncharacterized protein LOC129592324 n=1 Tax=Paramacrobiotus metropolitanus TaxID=2943436 RepID=UPI00244583E6|nr:uncharacterized protein LOC129592324 [Paramacrobiotus metropolitanus]